MTKPVELSHPKNLSFKCSDAGVHCDWVGQSQDEGILMLLIEDHARVHHNMIVDGSGREKIRSAIKRNAAASAGK
jgi:predicted small metal-binding protein